MRCLLILVTVNQVGSVGALEEKLNFLLQYMYRPKILNIS